MRGQGQRGVSVGESRSGEREGREMGVRRNVRLDVLLAIVRTISHSALFCAHVRTTGQRNNPGMQAQVLPLTQHLIGSDFQPHVGCMNCDMHGIDCGSPPPLRLARDRPRIPSQRA